MATVLKAEDVSIRYITGDFKDIGIKEYVTRRLTGNYHVKEFMAVDGVSFALEEGDMLGIIGANGAGKSTLLKAVAGIMEPTRGKIIANGEVAALLELGSGFDGDLTVRENAYLRGAMLGYTKEFMDATYGQIIDFAELREFEDRPFKQLSSGMKSRLAFSIASLVKPDILILDEVLSVGDGAFQEKSASKMREIISQGATTILVSHSLEQIRSLCNKVLWLDHGKQVAFGDTKEICDQYERFLQGTPLPEKVDIESPVQPVGIEIQKKECPSRIGVVTVLCAIVLGIFTGFVTYMATGHLSEINRGVDIIRMSAQEGEVTYRGAAMGDIWYSPSDTVIKSDGWEVNWDEATYRATDGQYLEVALPRGGGRTLTFNAGPDQGVVKIVINENEQYFSLYNDTIVPLGLPYHLLDSNTQEKTTMYLGTSVGASIIFTILVLLLSLKSKPEKSVFKKEGRELWGDALRIICCFMIVLLHNTCNVFDDYADGRQSVLWVNCFTAFAVPCFFMLSGAYLLRRQHGVKETLVRRVPRIVIPTLFWGIIYMVVTGDPSPENFGKLLFQNQASHLWFMYSLFGIYMLLPAFSAIYQSISQKQKIYLLALLLIIPSAMYDSSKLLGIYIPLPSFSIFWPDLGLFLCGGLLWEMRDKIQQKHPRFYAALFLLGLGITALGTVLISDRMGSVDKTFISAIGSIGNLVMAISVLCVGMSIAPRLERGTNHGMAMLIHQMAETTMGVYLIHVLFLIGLNSETSYQLPLYSNTGSMAAMIGSAVIYFLISTVVCWCGKRIYGIKNLFG